MDLDQADLRAPADTGTAARSSAGQSGQEARRPRPHGALAGGRGLRLYYADPAMVGSPEAWAPVFDHAAAMGFSAVALPPPFDPGPGGSLLLPWDWERAHPLLPGATADEAVAALAGLAAARGLALVLDIVADRVAVHGPLAAMMGAAGAAPSSRDPRVRPESRDALPLAGLDAGHIGALLAARLARLAEAGAAGLRCLAPDRVAPDVWRAVRAAAPGLALLAWTPGVPADRQAGLTGFDALFSSLGWWDCRSAWPVDERDVQAPLGASMAFPEAPFDARLAATLESRASAERRAERALWLAAALADGLLVPMGFEYGAREPMSARLPAGGGPARETFERLRSGQRLDLTARIAEANRFLAGEGGRPAGAPAGSSLSLLAGGAAPVTALLRRDGAGRNGARLVLVNPALDRAGRLPASALSPEAGRYLPFRDAVRSSPNLGAEGSIVLTPGEVRIMEGSASRPILLEAGHAPDTGAPRLVVEALAPAVDGGRHAVKRIVGEVLRVEADVYGEGHDLLAVALLWRAADETAWRERRMQLIGNDRWAADMPLDRLGRYEYTVEAWRDEFAIFRSELVKKHEAGLAVPLELEEGRRLVERTLTATKDGGIAARLKPIAASLKEADDAGRLAILLSPETREAMMAADPRPYRLRHDPVLVDAERTAAGFAAWYSLFPRSQSGDPARHGTFDDVIGRIPAIKAMGFDVLYFTPIHPIGTTNRKGRNNSLKAGPGDPGSPYAIGSVEGGHEAVHPELGGIEAFRRLVAAAGAQGMEVALDIAIQASPDHPWLKQHPDWFDWRPDGTIRYAENPPKKYEDIVNVDFYAKGAKPGLWVELRDIILGWVKEGVKLFRVDNPHTKPFPFWEWLIGEVRAQHPDVVFLSEAFTKPKVMYRLAKVGFSQSYTYFTWRNAKWDITEYLTELTQTAPRDFFRPHFFVNTHDINPDYLQDAPRPAFLIRAALAATLSGLWGIYNGFELCEGRPDAKRKEYADSEKYEIKAWDHDRPGNIVGEITRLNRIRRDTPALHTHLGLTFYRAQNETVLWFGKATPTRDSAVLVAISLDPANVQEADAELPLWEWNLPDSGSLRMDDLFRGVSGTWTGKNQRLRLDPGELPFSIWRASPA